MPDTSVADQCCSSTAAGVVLASGSGTRVGADRNKVYLPLVGRSVLSWSLTALDAVAGIGVLVLVVRPEDAEQAMRILATEFTASAVEIVFGGATRQESELCALRHLTPRITAGEIDTVLIHDAARPLISPELAGEVLRVARDRGAAIPGLPRDDVMAATDSGVEMIDGKSGTVMAVQTPQGFRADPLLSAYEQAASAGFVGTDTASCVARFTDLPVHCIAGSERNFKITYAHDLVVAERMLSG